MVNDIGRMRFLKFVSQHIRFSYSQRIQDLFGVFVNEMKSNGYFVEFGALSGINMSNSYLMERLGWEGIACEPHPSYGKLLEKNRGCHISTDCVFTESNKMVSFSTKVGRPAASTITEYVTDDDKYETFSVNTISLLDLLKQFGAPSVIDFISIDTEGSEFKILSSFDFSQFKFNAICVEHNYSSDRKKLKELLNDNGYSRIWEDLSGHDDWYVSDENLKNFPNIESVNYSIDSELLNTNTNSNTILEILKCLQKEHLYFEGLAVFCNVPPEVQTDTRVELILMELLNKLWQEHSEEEIYNEYFSNFANHEFPIINYILRAKPLKGPAHSSGLIRIFFYYFNNQKRKLTALFLKTQDLKKIDVNTDSFPLDKTNDEGYIELYPEREIKLPGITCFPLSLNPIIDNINICEDRLLLIPPVRLYYLKDVFVNGHGVVVNKYFELLGDQNLRPYHAIRVSQNMYRLNLQSRFIISENIDDLSVLIHKVWPLHFGHWLFDNYACFSSVEKYFEVNKLSVVLGYADRGNNWFSMKGPQGHSLKFIGVEEDNLVGIKENEWKYFKKLIVPSPVNQFMPPSRTMWDTPEIYPFFRSIKLKALKSNKVKQIQRKFQSKKRFEKIYLTRGNSPNRELLNSDECEDIAVKCGFKVIDPAEYSLIEQILIFDKAKVITGPVGGAFHACIFANENTAILPILPKELQYVLPYYQTMAVGTKSNLTPFISSNSQIPHNGKANVDVKWSVNTKELIEYFNLFGSS